MSSTGTVRPAARFLLSPMKAKHLVSCAVPGQQLSHFAILHFLLQTKGKLPRSQPANDEFAVASDEAAQNPE